MSTSSDLLPPECWLQHSRMTSWVFLLLACFSLFPQIGRAQNGSQLQSIANNKEGGVRWVMKQYPSLRVGDVLRVDFRARFQADLRQFSPDIKPEEPSFTLHRARFGIQGSFLKRFEYEVEREFQDSDHPWRDVALNYRAHHRFEIQGGRFKVPFGLDQLTRITDLDYVFRSRVSETIAPGRDTGLMAHGRFFKRGLNYQAASSAMTVTMPEAGSEPWPPASPEHPFVCFLCRIRSSGFAPGSPWLIVSCPKGFTVFAAVLSPETHSSTAFLSMEGAFAWEPSWIGVPARFQSRENSFRRRIRGMVRA